MEILIGIAIVLGGGYFWAIGGWYSRIVATVLFVPFGAFCGAGLVSLVANEVTLPLAIALGAISGGIAGWYLAAWPRWYWRRQDERLETSVRAEIAAKHAKEAARWNRPSTTPLLMDQG